MLKKHTIDFLKEEFNKAGYILLSTEYKNNKLPLDFICDKGHTHKISYDALKRGQKCGLCVTNHKKYDISFVKSEFEKVSYKLLSTEYSGNKQQLDYICDKGHKNTICWNDFSNGVRCPICSAKKRSEEAKLSYNFIKSEFEEIGYQLLSAEYNNAHSKLEYICDKGHTSSISYNSFKNGKRCLQCYNDRRGDTLKLDYSYVKTCFEEYNYTLLTTSYNRNTDYLKYICDKGHINQIGWGNFKKGHRCPQCSNRHSKAELEIYELIKSYFPNTQNGNRSLIAPFELDIVIPEKKFAIEYCGLYWHSELSGKDKNYHLNKLQKCNEIGYRLITIFEDEYINKKEIVINRLKHILSLSEAKTIHARKCEIKEIDATIKDEFINRFHLQGTDRSVIKLGAYYQDKLVSVMTFGKGNIAKGAKYEDNIYELNRFCLDYNYKISGIANRFINYFKNNYTFNEIYTYSDKRWSDGDLYQKLGFEYLHDSVPNYWYILDNNRIHRYNFRKSELNKKLENFNPELSEWSNMVENGFDRIWDCGNVKWRLK